MMALYTVFLLPVTASVLQLPKYIRNAWPWLLWVFVAVFLFWIIRRWVPSHLRLDETLGDKWKVGFITYYAYLGIGLFIFTRAIKTARNEIHAPLKARWTGYSSLIFFPLLLMFNGFGPYVGLKTQTSFSMFSNLHTENGMSNHLIVPAGIQLTNWQYDLVEIIDSSDPNLNSSRDNNLLIVYLDLRRIRTNAVSGFWVKFRRNGNEETFYLARSETYDVLPPLDIVSRRYFYFRPVETDPMQVRCKH